MKVRYKINTLRGIFFCLKMNKGRLCPRTVFSQTQEIKNVCLKRRFQSVGRRLQIENTCPLAWKEFAYFSPALRCSPLGLKKANTLLLLTSSIYMILAARSSFALCNRYGSFPFKEKKVTKAVFG